VKAVVLCSGGIDSTTVMAIARDEGYALYCLSFAYGQRHRVELQAAGKVAAAMRARQHLVLDLPLGAIGGSVLTAPGAVPKGRAAGRIARDIPATYVPARNTIFLSCALAWAEVIGSRDIFIGANAVDYSGYPDCRPEFIKSFEDMANLATKAGVEGSGRIRIHAPLLAMTKARIIQQGLALGVDYGMTHSCYDPDPRGWACGRCDSCILRRRGFADAGIPDPTSYTDA
jgi:7-cyano-7-deazaguanine synthase